MTVVCFRKDRLKIERENIEQSHTTKGNDYNTTNVCNSLLCSLCRSLSSACPYPYLLISVKINTREKIENIV